jgi:hypothetical protein
MKKLSIKNPNLAMQVGLLVFVLAECARKFFGLGGVGASDLSDAGLGLLMGISIALMLLSVVMRKNKTSC